MSRPTAEPRGPRGRGKGGPQPPLPAQALPSDALQQQREEEFGERSPGPAVRVSPRSLVGATAGGTKRSALNDFITFCLI
jgi:hypothetical protein